MTPTFELVISKLKELPIKLNRIPAPSRIHLPDKPNSYPNTELVKFLTDRELALTFSIGNHYNNGNFELIVSELKLYLEVIKTKANVKELLIVSGPTVRRIDTLDVLEYLQNQTQLHVSHSSLTISVAYNCQSLDQDIENKRLKTKLSHSIVTKVYIQITDSINKIITGINFIRNLKPDIKICVCIFQPTATSLAKFRFRPWKGVVLSDIFLKDHQNAARINHENLKQLEVLNVETVITV